MREKDDAGRKGRNDMNLNAEWIDWFEREWDKARNSVLPRIMTDKTEEGEEEGDAGA